MNILNIDLIDCFEDPYALLCLFLLNGSLGAFPQAIENDSTICLLLKRNFILEPILFIQRIATKLLFWI